MNITDSDFNELSQSNGDDRPSRLERFCGGIPLPPSELLQADEDEGETQRSEADWRRPPMPLTTFAWLDRDSGFKNLGGRGDLSGAYVLTGTDHPSRTCPSCEVVREDGQQRDECEVSSGSTLFRWSDDFRYRAGLSEGPLHLLIAECSPHVRAADFGWSRACWHAEIPQASIGPNEHLRVDVGGISTTIERDTSDLDRE